MATEAPPTSWLHPPVQHAQLCVFHILQDVVHVFIIIALPPAQHPGQVVACAKREDGHMRRVLGRKNT